MTLQQLTYFLAAAEHGSFSAAADSLNMAQPSLSEQIRRLEAEMGVPLFVRAGRGLELTEAGRRLRPHAERTLAESQAALDSVREMRDLTGGTVAFGTFGSAHYYLLGGLVQDFRTRHPQVRVRVIGQNSVEVADAVRDGSLEAGLVAIPVDDRGLDVRPAFEEELLYVSAEPERVRAPLTIERLAAAPLILYDARWAAQDPIRRQLRELAQRAGVVIEPQIEVEYMTAAFDLAARGLGDTIGPSSVLTARGFSRRLGTVAFAPPLSVTFAFITRRDAHLSPATRVFLSMAERRVQALARRGLGLEHAFRAARHRRRRGVPADDLLAARGRAADDRRERRPGDATVRAHGARDGRPAGARRLHHARDRQVDLVHSGGARAGRGGRPPPPAHRALPHRRAEDPVG